MTQTLLILALGIFAIAITGCGDDIAAPTPTSIPGYSRVEIGYFGSIELPDSWMTFEIDDDFVTGISSIGQYPDDFKDALESLGGESGLREAAANGLRLYAADTAGYKSGLWPNLNVFEDLSYFGPSLEMFVNQLITNLETFGAVLKNRTELRIGDVDCVAIELSNSEVLSDPITTFQTICHSDSSPRGPTTSLLTMSFTYWSDQAGDYAGITDLVIRSLR